MRLTENAPFDINAYLLPFAIVVGICFIIMLGELLVLSFLCYHVQVPNLVGGGWGGFR